MAERDLVAPLPAATVLVLREAEGGVEVFCVRRHQGVAFMGGVVVFPGGKLDPQDRSFSGAPMSEPDPRGLGMTDGSIEDLRALAIAACRETIEEAALVAATDGGGAPLDDAAVLALRAALEGGARLDAALEERGARLDLAALVPFARWVTPEAESRRYDARFFLLRLPAGQEGSHCGHETTLGFWDRPASVLARFASGEIQLAPPTTRSLELLSAAKSFAEATEVARAQSLMPVCPHFVPDDPPALVLPGDPAHPIRDRRVEGPSRFVLRDGRFISEDGHLPSR